jgi:DNA-binding LytR/AlgR family response regulator
MKVLIVEDETIAFITLQKILAKIDTSIEIAGNSESVEQTVKWLKGHPAPDLIFMDIHLSDGSAFNIFKFMTVKVPIIFTTAYDEYAIQAFKVNSVDYLLKPIKIEELRTALEKFSRLNRNDVLRYLSQLPMLAPPAKFPGRLLISQNDQLIPVSLKEVAFFYTTGSSTEIHMRSGEKYLYGKSLETIMQGLDPQNFYRANKQFILSRTSIKKITIWFDSRLLISLEVDTPERLYVSKNRSAEFKKWLTSEA